MNEKPNYLKISARDMEAEFLRILIKHGFTSDNAKTCARIFTENSIDGVYTHGVNRFPRFVKYVAEGHVRQNAEPVLKHAAGAVEQWDGQLGAGPLNALKCTQRAMELASASGIGCVALANTNHWMRGGTYGREAAKNGFVFIGWTNTIANMPAWGAIDSKLGNNPLVIGMPYKDEPVVLDMAMSQYSYGALELYEMKKEKLPVPGGYDSSGNLTQDAITIRESKRILPIGYWKGAGLSLLLDILAAVLSGGLSTAEISRSKDEISLSQVFIAIDLSKLQNFKSIEVTLQQIIDDYHQSVPARENGKIVFPGERVVLTRNENLKNGIPVLEEVWNRIQAL
ncbi:3-dehydro-L-gulonate 2-dehydrogenase [Chryseosolibacter indicus]|uniref:3-dehydro-L-gulonate 2-dehydrogenase n=1 Tax=Chryseosolibacter indicus TaxID=2782351 RepID=A0ABS5VRL2_9BACT|nr:3-dehydro-L-gulonate 2-dehydrogenase [Chryseosolibacter indicus]MBT1703432.1 3-dehydro-L-gulonate 2-dehydrogenase [Chryseosolibacter indicus]